MLQRLARFLSSKPWIYDVIQDLAGQRKIARIVRGELEQTHPRSLLDVGSAAGTLARRLGVSAVHIDIDLAPLVAAEAGGRLVNANGAALPFVSKSFDVSLCVFVGHHVDDATLDALTRELSRVTRHHVVFVDWLRNDRRVQSRLLARYDRGTFGRDRARLLDALDIRFERERILEFSVYHQYLLFVGSPRAG